MKSTSAKPEQFPCPFRGGALPPRDDVAAPLFRCLHDNVQGPCVVDFLLPRYHDVASCQRCPIRRDAARGMQGSLLKGPQRPVIRDRNAKSPPVPNPQSPSPNLAAPPTRSLLIHQPPPLALTPRANRALVTINVGEEAAAMLASTRPLMQQYAKRVQADFVELTWPGHPEWPMSSKFAIACVLEHYPRIAYVDADVLLRPGCLNLFEACQEHEMGVVDELPWHRMNAKWGREAQYQAFRAAMGFPTIEHLPWMFNAGVMVIPASHRHLLLPPLVPMPIAHCAEQDHTNARLLDSHLPYRLLDRRCNWQNWTDWGFHHAPADAILHLSGGGVARTRRVEQLAELAADVTSCRGDWAVMPSPISPSAISNQQSAISFPADDAGWQMDARHVRWIHQVAMSGRFRHALEIGSYRGYSSVALLEAWAAGQLAELTLCEPEPPPELLALIAHYSQQRQPDTLHLDRRSSELVLADRGRQCDLVVLDGDHRDAVGQAEAALLLADPPRAIFAHDTSLGWPDFRGPALLKQALQQAGWHVLEDNLLRPGERTERGLTFAAPSLSTKFLAIASLTACGD